MKPFDPEGFAEWMRIGKRTVESLARTLGPAVTIEPDALPAEVQAWCWGLRPPTLEIRSVLAQLGYQDHGYCRLGLVDRAGRRLELDGKDRLSGRTPLRLSEDELKDRIEYVRYLESLPPCDCLSHYLLQRGSVESLALAERRALVRDFITQRFGQRGRLTASSFAFACPRRILERGIREENDVKVLAEGSGRAWWTDAAWVKIRRRRS